jgi:hypothetical protein
MSFEILLSSCQQICFWNCWKLFGARIVSGLVEVVGAVVAFFRPVDFILKKLFFACRVLSWLSFSFSLAPGVL